MLLLGSGDKNIIPGAVLSLLQDIVPCPQPRPFSPPPDLSAPIAARSLRVTSSGSGIGLIYPAATAPRTPAPPGLSTRILRPVPGPFRPRSLSPGSGKCPFPPAPPGLSNPGATQSLHPGQWAYPNLSPVNADPKASL